MAVQSFSNKWCDKCLGAREKYLVSYFHLAFLFCATSLLSESLLQAILHAAKLPATTLPRFCCSRETGANNNDHPSLNQWHASVGGWLKCYFHFSFPNYLSYYFKFFRSSSSYEFSLTIGTSTLRKDCWDKEDLSDMERGSRVQGISLTACTPLPCLQSPSDGSLAHK